MSLHSGVIAGLLCIVPVADEDTASFRPWLVRPVIDTDVRMQIVGDSFTVPFASRLFSAALRSWPIENVTAISGGAHEYGTFISTEALCSPVEHVVASGGYEVERDSKGDQFFALPVFGMLEVFGGSDLSIPDGLLFSTDLDLDVFDTSSESETIEYRQLFWCPTDPDDLVSSVELACDDTSLVVDLRSGVKPGHINVTPPLEASLSCSSFEVREADPLVDSGDYFDNAGVVVNLVDGLGNRRQGLYFSALGDSSWSYAGYGVDSLPSHALDKRFGTPQLANWIEATTLDSDQPVVLFYHLDVELLDFDAAYTQMQAMVERMGLGFESADVEAITHCIVIPMMHKQASTGIDDTHAFFQAQRDAALAVAAERDDMAVISIYDATDGVFFNGSAEAIQWLLDHGYDDLAGAPHHGDLLDSYEVHIGSAEAAQFFAQIMLEEFQHAYKPGDVTQDDAVNLADLLLVISNWGGCDGSCDTPCEGDANDDCLVNLADLLIVIGNWGS